MNFNPALMTDMYEFTMVDAALSDGTYQKKSVFSVFTRDLPEFYRNPNFQNRKTGIVGGTYRLLDIIKNFHYDDEQLKFLSDQKIVSKDCIKYLEQIDFNLDIDGFKEGNYFFKYSPILNVIGDFAKCTLLETIILSVLNYDSAVASNGFKIVQNANDRPLLEMGSRRTNEFSAIFASRIAKILGFKGTSNLEAAKEFDFTPIGTVAHSFILSYPDEKSAFLAQIKTLGVNSTFLVDTYNIETAIRTLCEITNNQAGAIRIDSGDLKIETSNARKLLDSLGAYNTKIVVSGDLTFEKLLDLQNSPIDSYGIGTDFVTAHGHPTCAMVYKITQSEDNTGQLVPVGKQSWNKATPKGHRVAYRKYSNQELLPNGEKIGNFEREEYLLKSELDDSIQNLQNIPLMENGALIIDNSLTSAQQNFQKTLQFIID